MKANNWTVLCASLLFSSALQAVESGDIALTHYEPLQRLSIQVVGDNNGVQKLRSASSVALRFDALGRGFDLLLEPNERVTPTVARDEILTYRGQLTGNPDSWARIVVYNGMPRGVIWDGNEMFAVEAPGDSLLATTEPLIYRLADALIAPGSMSCASGSSVSTGAASLQKLTGELGTVIARAPGAISELTMGAVGDFLFTELKGGAAGAEAAITARLNIVDGIFSEQLGVQINVKTFDTFIDDAADPFSTTGDAETLLIELSNYRDVTPSQNTHGLTHLYTGRDVSGSTVGIAWNSALCSDYYGAGLSEGLQGSTFDALVAAHEIGHNFGAPHDGESGSACEAEAGAFIMAPRLNMRQQFSSCSIAQMQDDIDRASCVALIPAVDMSVELKDPSTTLLLGAITALEYEVVNNGLLEATNVQADFILPATLSLGVVSTTAGTCSNGAGMVACDLGTVAGQSSQTVTINVVPSTLGAGVLGATVSADVDDRPANNQASLQVSVDPAVDLVINTPTSSPVLVNSITTINAVLENQSDIAASSLTLSISLGTGLQANTASWSIGTCTVTPQQVDCQATGLAARAASNLRIDVRGITAGNKNFSVDLASAEAEANPGNNSVASTVRVNEPADKDEGGGGTTPAFLLLLALSGAIGRRRSSKLDHP